MRVRRDEPFIKPSQPLLWKLNPFPLNSHLGIQKKGHERSRGVLPLEGPLVRWARLRARLRQAAGILHTLLLLSPLCAGPSQVACHSPLQWTRPFSSQGENAPHPAPWTHPPLEAAQVGSRGGPFPRPLEHACPLLGLMMTASPTHCWPPLLGWVLRLVPCTHFFLEESPGVLSYHLWAWTATEPATSTVAYHLPVPKGFILYPAAGVIVFSTW